MQVADDFNDISAISNLGVGDEITVFHIIRDGCFAVNQIYCKLFV